MTNLSITTALILLTSIIMVSIIGLILLKKKLRIIPCIFLISSLLLIIILAVNIHTAKKHGLYTMKITINELFTGIENSPVEDKLPKELTGSIVLYYKFGCKDCEAIYKDLAETVTNNKNVYWISTKSKQGKKLLKEYPVDEVPTGIYIRHDTFNGSIKYTKKPLHKTQNNKTILDIQNIGRLIFLQQEKR